MIYTVSQFMPDVRICPEIFMGAALLGILWLLNLVLQFSVLYSRERNFLQVLQA